MLQPEHTYEIDYFFRQVLMLSNEDLIAELTDHFSASIDDLMARGRTFPEALQEVFEAFGGQQAIRHMEWEYNRVTFRKYDRFWKDAVLLQFTGRNLWITIAVFMAVSCIGLLYRLEGSEQGKSFFEGVTAGLWGSTLIIGLGVMFPYLKSLIIKGAHNPQSEAWYLTKRTLLFSLAFVILALLPNYLPILYQPALSGLYFTAFYVYLRTQGQLYRFLYDVPEVY
nr:hypothetical protein [uncultured Arsenicibacter sp.]